MSAYLPYNQRMAIQIPDVEGHKFAAFDLTGLFVAGTPTPTMRPIARLYSGRRSVDRFFSKRDNSYQFNAFMDDKTDIARKLIAAARAFKTLRLLEYQLDSKHWWSGNLLIPSLPRQPRELLEFDWNMLSAEEPAHGYLHTDGEDASVPPGGVGMIYVKTPGNVTEAKLRYVDEGAGKVWEAEAVSTNPSSITVAAFAGVGGIGAIPAGSSHKLELATVPANPAGAEIIIGWGLPVGTAN